MVCGSLRRQIRHVINPSRSRVREFPMCGYDVAVSGEILRRERFYGQQQRAARSGVAHGNNKSRSRRKHEVQKDLVAGRTAARYQDDDATACCTCERELLRVVRLSWCDRSITGIVGGSRVIVAPTAPAARVDRDRAQSRNRIDRDIGSGNDLSYGPAATASGIYDLCGVIADFTKQNSLAVCHVAH